MAKEQEQLEEQKEAEQVAATSQTPNYDTWRNNMHGKYGKDKSDEELYALSMSGYDSEHEYAKKSRKQAEDAKRFIEADENVNNFLIDFWEWGGKGKAWKAFLHLQPLWRQYINGEIQDEEFEAELRRMNEAYEKEERIKQMAANAFDRVCEKRGIDPEETRQKLNDLLFREVETDEEAEQQVENMFRVLDFDSAVAAAETRGRNTTISEERRKVPTSSPKGGAGVTPRQATTRNRGIFATAEGDE